MAKTKVPGLQKATGEQGFPVLDPGMYEVTVCDPPKWKETNAGDGDMFNIQLSIVDGPKQGENGKDPNGRLVFHSIFIPHPEHPSYDACIEMGLNRLKALCNVAEVEIGSGGSFDEDDFVESNFMVRIGIEKVDKNDEASEKRNIVKKVLPKN